MGGALHLCVTSAIYYFLITKIALCESLQRFANRYNDLRIATTICESLQRFVNRYNGLRIATTVREPLQRFVNRYNGS
ncbi:MAG: hypothetical protein JNL70_16015 [Saprospiraceae bacterium]|nr:hypothetical protein [Saprospiraceae bacterium]